MFTTATFVVTRRDGPTPTTCTMAPFVVHTLGEGKPHTEGAKKISYTNQSAEDLAILEQLNLD